MWILIPHPIYLLNNVSDRAVNQFYREFKTYQLVKYVTSYLP